MIPEKCPNCGLPLSYPRHDGEPCVPVSEAVLALNARIQGERRRSGTAGAWREMGAHQW